MRCDDWFRCGWCCASESMDSKLLCRMVTLLTPFPIAPGKHLVDDCDLRFIMGDGDWGFCKDELESERTEIALYIFVISRD